MVREKVTQAILSVRSVQFMLKGKNSGEVKVDVGMTPRIKTLHCTLFTLDRTSVQWLAPHLLTVRRFWV